MGSKLKSTFCPKTSNQDPNPKHSKVPDKIENSNKAKLEKEKFQYVKVFDLESAKYYSVKNNVKKQKDQNCALL